MGSSAESSAPMRSMSLAPSARASPLYLTVTLSSSGIPGYSARSLLLMCASVVMKPTESSALMRVVSRTPSPPSPENSHTAPLSAMSRRAAFSFSRRAFSTSRFFSASLARACWRMRDSSAFCSASILRRSISLLLSLSSSRAFSTWASSALLLSLSASVNSSSASPSRFLLFSALALSSSLALTARCRHTATAPPTAVTATTAPATRIWVGREAAPPSPTPSRTIASCAIP
mmetsp:Transcript_22612/g.57166  ORF Transcript_22612/g.57166 Transcript_22612/m.57166 type:complete len:232 (-) Transcript_22612:264-959(-)